MGNRLLNSGKYTFTGRLLLVIFHSDESVHLNSFEIEWRADGPIADVEMYSNDDRIYHYVGSNGTASWNISSPPNWPGMVYKTEVLKQCSHCFLSTVLAGFHVGLINRQEILASNQAYMSNLSMSYQLRGDARLMVFNSDNATFTTLVKYASLLS